MKVYQLKFESKQAKREFAERNHGEDFMLSDEKKKSVVVKAKNKDKIRDMIADTERQSTSPHSDYGYCFGREDEDYSIKKLADSEEEYEME